MGMGRKMDALLGRNFKTAKFKTLLNLAVSRLAVLKNQRQVRSSQARSDTCQLLNLGHQDRALLRVEHVIKEQNMLDVFVMLEGYCHVLMERLVLLETNKVCPEELKEAVSSLIFAASRCGEFPELLEIREVFVSRFGKDFVARSVELRSTCGVTTKMIQKLSTRQPNMETRMKALQEIASENGVVLNLEVESSVTEQNQPERNALDKLDGDQTEMNQEEQFSESMKARKKYATVASAAQAAFESAAYAATAARAAMELSRSGSQDNFSDDDSSPTPRRRNRPDNDGSSKSRLGNAHPVDNSDSESETEEVPQVQYKVPPLEDCKEKEISAKLERSVSSSSADSVEDKISPNVLGQNVPSENININFDTSGDETKNENRIQRLDAKTSEGGVRLKRLNIERRPISVRTRKGYGQ